MATSSDSRRVNKRSSNACTRCRRQKIKCSGLQPCANCTRRNLGCVFDDRDNKVLVTQGYLSDLHAKLGRLEHATDDDSSTAVTRRSDQNATERAGRRDSHDEQPQQTRRPSAERTQESSPGREQTNPDGTDLVNPLLESPSKFIASPTGRPFYLGTSSNWSFHGRVLTLVHEYIYKTPLPGSDLLFDGSAYDLRWDGTRNLPDPGASIIPSIDYAMFLINAVKFHCAQLVHLFDEDEFMANLHVFYSNSGNKEQLDSLWYIHFLVIIAFGKTFVQNKQHAPRPPGSDFFIQALQLLPDNTRLSREPGVATVEVLCCIALYLQGLDSRSAAHVTISQAMSLALSQGMHTDMPVANLGEVLVQRCRKVWWTVYLLSRQMTSLMGLPQSVSDSDITCQLPVFANSAHRTATLSMQIKLARISAEISRTVYGVTGKLRRKFVVNIKIALEKLTPLAEELRESFPLRADERFGGISRMPAHLHLSYYQSIVVVTRPLLYCCFKKVFGSPREVEPLISSRKVRNLLHMSLEASQKIIDILESLLHQDLLETFLPWDLDALFVSTMVFTLTRFVDHSLFEDHASWLGRAFGLLEIMSASGNRIAQFRTVELRKLDEMLAEYPSIQAQLSLNSALERQNTHTPQQSVGLAISEGNHAPMGLMHPQDGMPIYADFSDESVGFGEDLTAEQILAVTECIDIENTDWLSFATMQDFQI